MRKGTARAGATAITLDDFRQRDAERYLDQAAPEHVAGELEGHRSGGGCDPKLGVGAAAALHDAGNGGVGNDVVNHGGLAEEASDGGHRWLGANLPASAFEAFEEGGFLAADVGTGADEEFEIEGVRTAEDAVAQHSMLVGKLEGRGESAFRVRVFRAQVDEASRGAGGDGGDGHAFDQPERVAFEQQAVRKGAGIAFVRVADKVLLLGGGVAYGAPLDVGRKASAAATAQARGFDLVDEGGGRYIETGFEGDRWRQCQRMIGAAAVEDDAVLAGEPVDGIHRAEAFGVHVALLEDFGYVVGRDVAPGGAGAGVVGHLHHRLGPGSPSGARAHHVQSVCGEDLSNRIGTTGNCGDVLGNVD